MHNFSYRMKDFQRPELLIFVLPKERLLTDWFQRLERYISFAFCTTVTLKPSPLFHTRQHNSNYSTIQPKPSFFPVSTITITRGTKKKWKDARISHLEYYIANVNLRCFRQYNRECQNVSIHTLLLPRALALRQPLHFFKLAYTKGK